MFIFRDHFVLLSVVALPAPIVMVEELVILDKVSSGLGGALGPEVGKDIGIDCPFELVVGGIYSVSEARCKTYKEGSFTWFRNFKCPAIIQPILVDLAFVFR